ncbi:MAG: hypothetical protein ACTHJW_07990 [Streptosporangiaceae bacterium]
MMDEIQISLTMPVELGAEVLSAPDVSEAIGGVDGVRVVTGSDGRQAGAAFVDFGATAIAILGSAAAVAGIKALFGVIKTAVEQAYKTHRERQAQNHELRKLILILGNKRNEIDLDQRAEQINERIAQLEREALKLIS